MKKNSKLGWEAIKFLSEKYHFNTVLDIGAGVSLEHSIYFNEKNKKTTAVDYDLIPHKLEKVFPNGPPDDIELFRGGFDIFLEQREDKYDCLWCCHCLEHVEAPIPFLKTFKQVTREGSIICVTVPPLKHNIVNEHITLWNGGLLLYNLVLAGYNCKNASVKKYGYNISVIIEREDIEIKTKNIDVLSNYLPDGYNYFNFNGDIDEINWK